MLSALGRLRGAVRPRLGRRARAGAHASAGAEAGAGREVDDLLRLARLSFVQFQAAWDRADLECLAGLATAPLLEDLRSQLAQRGPGPNCTEVLQVDARLLALDELREAYVASVEFSGLIRETAGSRAAPFRELWLLAKLKSAGRGWQLAQVQALS